MSKHKSKNKGKTLPVQTLKRELARLFSVNKSKRYTTMQVLRKLKVGNSIESIQHAIDQLIKEGVVYHANNEYKWDVKSNTNQKSRSAKPRGKEHIGKVDLTRSNDGYILVEDLDDDVYVPGRYLMGAMSKDIVKIVVAKNSGRRRPEGKVIEIIERAVDHAIGRLMVGNKFSTIVPIKKELASEIYIKNDALGDAKDGDYVLVKITEWGQNQNKGIWGIVSKKLEQASENDIAMQSIFLSHGFDLEFPPEVLEQVKDIELGITDEEIAKRRDFRNDITITIDPVTARDFDDAISYKALANGTFEIGVHIADVTHYVPEGSPLDKEALERSTSVYLVDRVLPMLPEKLSNNLCSLNPHEDRFTFSAVFIFDDKYNIIDEWFGRGVIHSDRRFSYEEAQVVIETGEGDYSKEIEKLNNVALKLRKDKFKNGAISFESDEIEFKLDENGKPISLVIKERKEAHMLVEDFMLLANKSVAKYIATKSKPEVPYIYRVHDTPNEEKLNDFALFAKELGFKMNLSTPKHIVASFNNLMEAAKTNETLELLTPLAIRTMSKAIYTTENIGHYGLGFEHYTHFTSPIRRYADVLVHRILAKNLGKDHRVNKAELEAKAQHISSKEKQASEAERESVKYKQTEYISDRIGEQFEGVVSGMIEKGFFVAMTESNAEGLIEFSTLDERYEMEDSRYRAVAPSGHAISMGQKVTVEVLAVNMEKRQIDMKLIDFLN